MFIPVGAWEKEGIKSRKIRIYPNKTQQKMMKQWMGTCRYVWNRALDGIKNKGEKINFQSLRNKYVTSKNNDSIHDWEKETPKDIRAGGLRDMEKGFKTALVNLKRGNIDKFSLRFKKKKDDKSLEVPASAIKYEKGVLFIYKTYMREPIRLSKDKKYLLNLEFQHNCRLSCEYGEWYLNVPVKYTVQSKKPKHGSCALDPGVRKFQTIYSEEMVVKIEVKKDLLRRLHAKLDRLQSLRDKKIIRKIACKRGEKRIKLKLRNLIDDLHWKTIKLLTDNWNTIFLPRFESQELGRKIKNHNTNRTLFSFKHYQFLLRLQDKCRMTEGCNIIICTEEYTSKTCGVCGELNNVGSNEVFACFNCGLSIDRDVNGARNILIKCINEMSN